MRSVLAAAITMALSLPAHADIVADFAAAQSVFAPLGPAATLDGLDGEWLPLSVLGGATPTSHADPALVPGLIERFCGQEPARGHLIETSSDMGFSMTVPGSGDLGYTFDWMGGVRFARGFDAQALFDRLGFTAMDDERRIEMSAQTLARTAREADVYRVAADLLVIETSQGAEIFGRCP